MFSELNYIYFWWLFFFLIGLTGIPLMSLLFKKFFDVGYGLSKTFGLLFVSYSVFTFSTFKILPFTKISLLLMFGLYFSLNFYLFTKFKDKIAPKIKKALSIIIFEELFFTSGLLLWAYVRSYQPDLNGLEKFMDFGFINAILRSEYLPPPDMWFAGKSINYYWFGHFVTAVATKITSVPSHISYNLMLGTILGLSLTSAFSLVSNLIYAVHKVKRLAIIGGIVSAILLNFAGNFHSTYYILKEGNDSYWYPDATRFIGYNPETNDKTIHEFPIYSYVVSDLHAHLLNFPFVLFFLSLLYASLYRREVKKLLVPIIGFLLGVMFMTNAWDFANYLLVLGFVYLIFHLKNKGFSIETFYKTALSILIIIAVAVISVLPFVLNFESIAEGVKLTTTKSPLWQLAILWGFPAILTVIFAIRTYLGRKTLKTEDLFIVAILISSWILIALPEFIYVKDIYVASHYRANTMFKLTYQAYVMFYLASGYIAIRTIRSFKKLYLKLISATLFLALFASVSYYPFKAVKSYYGDFKNPPKGLSGEIWLKDLHPDTYSAMNWFKENAPGQPVILEAPGDSYTEFNAISAYTGLPTVSGWFVHEWLWRGSSDVPQARVADITQIYTNPDEILTKSLLLKYNVKYVIVGNFEREKFPNLIEEKFASLGEIVFSATTTNIYQIN